MCYAIPGKVVSIEKDIAVIDYFGETKKARADLVTPQVGEYVYAQGGFIVNLIPEKEATKILEAWKEMFFHLKQSDEAQAKIREHRVSKEFKIIINKAAQTSNLTKDEAVRLLKTTDSEELKLLFETANQVRHRDLGNACCVHGIIEFSNHCTKSCSYCGLRNQNTNLQRYRMTPEQIINVAEKATQDLGFKAFVLQSGEDEFYSDDMLVKVIKEIQTKCGALVFVSVGNRSKKSYQKFYDAGARAVLIRFESSNPKIYSNVHNDSSLEERLQLIKNAEEISFLIATGSLIGLPNQTEEDIVEDLFLTRELGTEMYSFGPFLPHPDTPLANQSKPSLDLVLKTLAVARLLDPEAKILITTALETLVPEGKRLGLISGGNSLMINVTPQSYKELYSIYPNKAGTKDEIEQAVDSTVSLLKSLGRAPTDLGV